MHEDLVLDRTYTQGDSGGKVSLIQEWLWLNGLGVNVDGDFGPATAAAMKKFKQRRKLPPNSTVDKQTFDQLVAPMRAVLKPIPANGRSLGQLAVAYGQQHYRSRPREVGGPNRGPWVRLYMNWEGKKAYWCAGFACFILQQAADTLKVKLPFASSQGCRDIADSARQHHVFLGSPGPEARKRIKPGSLFLEEGGDTGYQHTGIVVQAKPDFMLTIEGNTNSGGSNNGFEVLPRHRGYGAVDFALLN